MAENYFNYTPENNLTDLPQFEPEMPIKKLKNVSNIIKMYPSKDTDYLEMLFPFQVGFKNVFKSIFLEIFYTFEQPNPINK